jgi:hypothetical protein
VFIDTAIDPMFRCALVNNSRSPDIAEWKDRERENEVLGWFSALIASVGRIGP